MSTNGINKVILIGKLEQEPNLYYEDENIVHASFSLETFDKVIKNGTATGQTERHNIVMAYKMAEAAGKMLKKGKLIYIEGKSITRLLEEKDGLKLYITEILADLFVLLGRDSDFDSEDVEKHSERFKRKRL